MTEDLSDIEFRLRARTQQDSPEGILLNYLNSKATLYPPKDMAMIALVSYWLPLAYRSSGKPTREITEQILRDCIYRLQLHLQYLQEMLKGELPVVEEVDSIEQKASSDKLNGLSTFHSTATEEYSPLSDEPNNQVDSHSQTPEWFNPLKSK